MAQEGLDDHKIDRKGYTDLLIIGKTGMGKSTTADKLLVANPTPNQYAPADHNDPTIDPQRGQMTLKDLVVWNLRDTPDEIKRVTTRLKNLVFFRGLENPHLEINASRKSTSHMYEETKCCELISNETSKIRVLDVPGYFGADSANRNPTVSVGENIWKHDLGIMRNILHIKAAMSVKFQRIVYFLPSPGPLNRPNAHLQQELREMAHYFGRPVFDCMVVVATVSNTTYRVAKEGITDSELFPREEVQVTEEFFQKALSLALNVPEQALPKPPIIFLSLLDTCDKVLEKIMQANVIKQSMNLAINPHTCARCAMTIQVLKGADDRSAPVGQGEQVKLPYACLFGNDRSTAMPYAESLCHPRMIPKHYKITKIVGGVAHLITFRKFLGRWPDFGNRDEVCLNCREPPHTVGCIQVRKDYPYKGETIRVDHSSNLDENVTIHIEGDAQQADAVV